MVNFPVLNSLDITEYGLYPGGNNSEPGLHINFQPGLTLVLGANGLGKTTLITIIYRLLTGPFDIPRIDDKPELGTVRLEPRPLSPKDRAIFAQRAMDNARFARATLSFRLGAHTINIERRLQNLSLTRLAIDDQLLAINEENLYQDKISTLAGVSSFGDWILLLRYLVFYFEDRRALVWDTSAQRQILRMLFLPVTEARRWTDEERVILELDSSMRNLTAILNREKAALETSEINAKDSADIRRQLDELDRQQKLDIDLRDRFETERLEVENMREQARLRLLKAEQEREARYRNAERTRLQSIATRFPSRSETARYILAQLITDHDCLVCGNHVPQIEIDYVSRIEHQQCVVCGSDLSNSIEQSNDSIDEFDRNIAKTVGELEVIESELEEASQTLEEAEKNFQEHVLQISEMNSAVSKRATTIDKLIRQLPPEESKLHEHRSQLMTMSKRVEEIKNELTPKREAFARFVGQGNRDVATRKESIKDAFDNYAEDFLIEKCQLIWSPQKATLGQSGSAIEFPAFELDMTGANFPSPVRRSGPEQVSESQREFIDLAFRMALMSVATNNGSSSLVMDAPESSIDAVFSSRAANVLSRFADPSLGNRLLITSNLVEGLLIPSLIAQCTTTEDRFTRVVDLIEIAAPTAAVRELREEYEAIRDKLLTGIEKDARS